MILREVARGGSFALAARTLSYSPSAVSQQMSALERSIGVTLFRRHAHGAHLTEAGEALLVHTHAVLDRLERAGAELRGLDGVHEPTVRAFRLGSFTSATSSFVGRAVGRFRDHQPGTPLALIDGEPYESLAGIAAGRVDLAVIFDLDGWPAGMGYDGESVSSDDELLTVALFDDPYNLVMPREHSLADHDVVQLDDLDGEIIRVANPWAPDLKRVCGSGGISPAFDHSCHAVGFEALQTLVGTCGGMTMMPSLALGWLRECLVAKPLRHAPVRHVKVVGQAAGFRSEGGAAMVEIVRRLVSELGLAIDTRRAQ